ncbi:MAG: 4a-hydroxytetrahydrobiopterin dehydratase [Candidatus Aenigmarchaeota archaeon]|nr:4a-hydroxytetrahydrobiopterin dehydratase [Candidatus Aenigmarchaeota archaeon]
MDLTKKHCVPCEGGVPPMSKEETEKYLKEVKGWQLVGNKIEKDLKFRNFKKAMVFVNRVAGLAEKEGHHPDILVYSWNKVKLITYTHAIGGLSENDFILAAKIDKII